MPLLVESTNEYPFELVVVAHADAETRIERLVRLRGMDPSEAERRIRSQASDEERLAVADVVIDTDGTPGADPASRRTPSGSGCAPDGLRRAFRSERTARRDVGGAS